MPRTISSAFQSFLQGELLTLAYIVLLTRPDGVQFGFTSADTDLVIGGITYEANNAVTGSAINQKAGTMVDNLDFVGLLRSDRITDADIHAGLYDGSAIVTSVVNYADLTMGQMILVSGVLGQVTTQDGRYQAEIRGLTQQLSQQVVDITSRTCRVGRLGNTLCQLNVAGTDPNTGQPYRAPATVASVASDNVTLTFTGTTQASGYFSYGVCHGTSGANNNIEREIKTHSFAGGIATVILSEPFPFAVAVGDTVYLEAGCDRNFATCVTKFANGINFQGEPDIPGLDAILKVGR